MSENFKNFLTSNTLSKNTPIEIVPPAPIYSHPESTRDNNCVLEIHSFYLTLKELNNSSILTYYQDTDKNYILADIFIRNYISNEDFYLAKAVKILPNSSFYIEKAILLDTSDSIYINFVDGKKEGSDISICHVDSICSALEINKS